MKKLIPVLACLFIWILGTAVWANWPIGKLSPEIRADRILVEKSKRSLTLFADDQVIKTYPISLGRAPVGAKQREGDLKTPEGKYTIIEHYEPSAFHLALRISYPGPADIQRAKTQGVSPGSDIMIHGMRNHLGLIGRLHRFIDWTAGCIAVTNAEIEEIWQLVPDGTPIEIRE